MLEGHFEKVHGLIHCSGGGQTKCLKYLPGPMHVIKDALFDAPPVFSMIAQASGADEREMYQVFNMGCRMEIYTQPEHAEELVSIAGNWGVEAKVIGRVEASQAKTLTIMRPSGALTFSHTDA
jgi:phosphoribosylformylglycinamidine cyclo-ligase